MPDGVRPGSGSVEGRGRGRPRHPRQRETALVPQNATLARRARSAGIVQSICDSIKGGRDKFMEYARYACEIQPDLAKVVKDWDALEPKAQKKANIEEICKQHDIDVFHFIAIVGEAAMKYRDTASVIIAGLSLPQVVQKSVQFALQKDGQKDREMLFKHSSFLPVPAGATFVNTIGVKTETHTEVNPASSSLPSFEKTIDVE